MRFTLAAALIAVAAAVGAVVALAIDDDGRPHLKSVRDTAKEAPALPECASTSPKAQPASVTFSCADAGINVVSITWSGWGKPVAQGEGTLTAHACVPSCAESNVDYRYSATVEATGLTKCQDGSLVYVRVLYAINDEDAAKAFDQDTPISGKTDRECPS